MKVNTKLLALCALSAVMWLGLNINAVCAQPGIAEMNQATGQLRQSFFSASSATLVLAAIFGIAGAVAVYHNWQMGKERITAEVAAWFFAAFFMILLGPFLQSLFGI
ncbi:DUF4134 family protein [Pedobacter nyackensis]|uniref:DUF4134 family protein n=1 Tax=Pedobacter nyackensis TaxID=475255 RepID=UPI002931A5E4|nr:DUF4134 family protein [Pedobacter nyackensis]